ncbi:MAG: hydroxyethylthiazole kinase [Lachnospiraceae bacterium]|nr:hydroxyethylthiazole kinase [Lachnospiraceae bacterium]
MNSIRKKAPLIHMITNGVSRESCANIVLAAGGSAICAEAAEEVEEIVDLADGLLLNIGMPTPAKKEAMLLALQRAKERKLPVVLDPVGVSASAFRKELVEELFAIGGITLIRGNRGEIAALCRHQVASRGVETSVVHLAVADVQQLSEATGAMVMASGEEELLVWKHQVIEKAGGGQFFCSMTGSGCMQSALLAASIAAAEDPWRGLVDGVSLFEAAGTWARAHSDGPGSFLPAFLDGIYLHEEE